MCVFKLSKYLLFFLNFILAIQPIFKNWINLNNEDLASSETSIIKHYLLIYS